MHESRKGMVKKIEPLKQRRRRYRIHSNLKKRGNCIVKAREKTVCLKYEHNTEIEEKWLAELKGYGYVTTQLIN